MPRAGAAEAIPYGFERDDVAVPAGVPTVAALSVLVRVHAAHVLCVPSPPVAAVFRSTHALSSPFHALG